MPSSSKPTCQPGELGTKHDSQSLPAGFGCRAANESDAADCARLNNHCGPAIHDPARFDADGVRQIWANSVADLSRDTRLVHTADGQLVGYFVVRPRTQRDVTIGVRGRVHPDYSNRGIASHLMAWAQARAAIELEHCPVTATVAMQAWFFEPHEPTKTFLTNWGFARERCFATMQLSFSRPTLVAAPPANVDLRPYDPRRHFGAVSRADWESFQGQWGLEASSAKEYEKEFARTMVHDPHYDPSYWFVAWDADEIAGVCIGKAQAPHAGYQGFVDLLAVLPAWRGRGLGSYLLQHAMAEYQRRGKTGVSLVVDEANPTHAGRLYERAGLAVTQRHAVYRKTLRAALAG